MSKTTMGLLALCSIACGASAYALTQPSRLYARTADDGVGPQHGKPPLNPQCTAKEVRYYTARNATYNDALASGRALSAREAFWWCTAWTDGSDPDFADPHKPGEMPDPQYRVDPWGTNSP